MSKKQNTNHIILELSAVLVGIEMETILTKRVADDDAIDGIGRPTSMHGALFVLRCEFIEQVRG